MNNVTSINKNQNYKMTGDFQKQNVQFDIGKLKHACNEVLKIKGFDTSLGIPHFAGISLNQIPGDPDSIKGNKVRGVYWTKPNSSGKEVSRDVKIEEDKYTEFVEDFNHTYFKVVYDVLKNKYKLGRKYPLTSLKKLYVLPAHYEYENANYALISIVHIAMDSYFLLANLEQHPTQLLKINL